MAEARFVILPKDGTPYIATARCCESKDSQHLGGYPVMAQVRLHWVTGPVEMCQDCAGRLLAVGRALGMVVHYEQIPVPPDPDPPADRALVLRVGDLGELD